MSQQQKHNAVWSAYKALCVIALNPAIKRFLAERDPNACEQVNNALGELEQAFDWIKIPEGRLELQREADFTFRDEGTIVLLTPQSVAAHEWIEVNLPDDAQWFANAICIERRYFQPILEGITEADLICLQKDL